MALIAKTFEDVDDLPTIGERLMERGRQEGIEQGIERGRKKGIKEGERVSREAILFAFEF